MKPAEINQKALAIAWVWGRSAGSLIYVPIRLFPQQTTCRCPWEGKSWLSALGFLLGYQCSASMSECFLPEKCSQLYFFFFSPTGFMETLCPFFSWRPSWCLSFAYQVLPSSLIGAAQTLLVKTGLHALLCKLKVCFPWRGLALFSRSFLGREGGE